ncbi:MAG: HAD family phosphatase [Clostridiales bacterium]|nr:HAD family phosphatase [Clostridiales bacterium]
MIKLIGFDVDNTLCELNSKMKDSTLEYLHKIRERGIKIAFISGKPAIYLCGFVRQLGLSDIPVIGENGAEVYYDANVPPNKTLNLAEGRSYYLHEIKNILSKEFGDSIWYQPNRVNVTCFFRQDDVKMRIRETLEILFTLKEYNSNLEFYEHVDCFDIVIKGITKGSGIKALCAHENISLDELLTVGDSKNDFSMFDVSKISIGINLYEEYDVDYRFDDIDSALIYILDNITAW